MNRLDWQEGDTLVWILQGHGVVTLHKAEKPEEEGPAEPPAPPDAAP